MTEYELVDLNMSGLAHLSTSAMGFISVFSGYVIVAFIAGRKLSSGIACSLTVVYSLFQISPVWGVSAGVRRMNRSIEEYVASYPDGIAFGTDPTGVAGLGLVLTFLPFLLAWFGSVLYMHAYVRRQVESNS